MEPAKICIHFAKSSSKKDVAQCLYENSLRPIHFLNYDGLYAKNLIDIQTGNPVPLSSFSKKFMDELKDIRESLKGERNFLESYRVNDVKGKLSKSRAYGRAFKSIKEGEAIAKLATALRS